MLSADALERIDREIAKYPPEHRQSAVMSALAIAQDEKGWLAPETMDFVAQYLGMPPVAVYEVATFYAMYNLQARRPAQGHDLHEPAVRAAGSDQAAAHLKARLGVGFGETTADGAITLKEGECMGACGDAPVLLVDNKHMCSWMDADKLDALIAELEDRRKGRS